MSFNDSGLPNAIVLGCATCKLLLDLRPLNSSVMPLRVAASSVAAFLVSSMIGRLDEKKLVISEKKPPPFCSGC